MANDKEKGPGKPKPSDEEILRMAAAIHEQRRVAGAETPHMPQITFMGRNSNTYTGISIQLQGGNPLESGNVPLHEHVAIAAEIFTPLLAQGLEEYRRRIEALTELP